MNTFLFLVVSIVFVIISISIDRNKGVLSKISLSFLIVDIGCYAVGKLLDGYAGILPVANKLCIGVMGVAILNIIFSIFRR